MSELSLGCGRVRVLTISLLLLFTQLGVFAQSVKLIGTETSFSESRPDYLHFKDVTLTRESKTSYQVEATLAASLPNSFKQDEVSFYVGFDIDNSTSTGDVGSAPQFGQDIGVAIIKRFGTNRFVAEEGMATIKGRKESVKITNLKMNGDKIYFDLRSSLFGDHDTFKFFICSRAVFMENGVRTSSIQVDTLTSDSTTFGQVN